MAARKRTPLPPGRPTKYQESYDEQAFKYCLLGATDIEMAGFFGVTEKTFISWKHNHPSFLQAIHAGKAKADANVAHSLYNRSLGYSHPAVKIFMDEGTPVYAPYTEHYPPDTNAASLWLRNRQPAKWRGNQDLDGKGEGNAQPQSSVKIEGGLPDE